MLLGRLTPRHRESDTVVHRGHITKQSSKLVRCAISVQRHPTRQNRADKTVSKLAAQKHRQGCRGTKLLTLVYYGLRDGHIRALTKTERREHSGRNACASLYSGPLTGVVALLMTPRVATAPLHTHHRWRSTAAEQPALPQIPAHHTVREDPTTNTRASRR